MYRPITAVRRLPLYRAPFHRVPPSSTFATTTTATAPATATPASSSPSFMERLESGPFRRYLGVEGGVLLRGGPFARLNATSPTFKKFNNALTLAPLWKWGLAIVPLMGVVTGVPTVENLDVHTSIALATTGAIWAYYSTLVRPKAVSLGVVSVALVLANGYNVYRRYDYETKKSAGSTLSAPLSNADSNLQAINKGQVQPAGA